MTREDVLAAIKDRHERSTPRGRDVRKMEKPYTCREVVFTCSNGWRIERLTQDDYPVEGWFMGHCLGGKHSVGSYANYSLREPDGTPHVTIVGEPDSLAQFRGHVELHGRCNAWPKPKYVALVNEWLASLNATLCPDERLTGWGVDDDDQYHEQGVHDDRDYRDLPGGRWWRDAAWRTKREVAT